MKYILLIPDKVSASRYKQSVASRKCGTSLGAESRRKDQVNLIINQLGLSSTDDQTAVLDDLEKAVTEVLAEHNVEPTLVKLIDGHTYSSIEADCPQCGDQLKLIKPSLDATNGATATASCNCGWYGDAVYRLIDLHEASTSQPTDTEDALENADEDILADSSCVNQFDVSPKYTPY